MMVIGKMIANKDLVFINIKMEIVMKDNLCKIRKKVKGSSYIKMVADMKGHS